MIIDTHCHLNFSEFDADRDAVIARARENGVAKMITIGCQKADFEKTLAIATKNDGIFAAVGFHPTDADAADFEILDKIAAGKKVVGIGETGLDFFRAENPPEKTQIQSLERHIFLAKKHKKPVVVHLRDAEKSARAFFKNHFDFDFEVHCFSGDWNFAKFLLDRGAFLGFGGIFTFKNAGEKMREVAKKCPADRILLETDAPFLAPVPHRGRRNEPAFLKDTAAFLAEIRGENFERFCEMTTKNAENFFGI